MAPWIRGCVWRDFHPLDSDRIPAAHAHNCCTGPRALWCNSLQLQGHKEGVISLTVMLKPHRDPLKLKLYIICNLSLI